MIATVMITEKETEFSPLFVIPSDIMTLDLDRDREHHTEVVVNTTTLLIVTTTNPPLLIAFPVRESLSA